MTGDGVPYTFTVPTSDWTSNGDFGIDKGEVHRRPIWPTPSPRCLEPTL